VDEIEMAAAENDQSRIATNLRTLLILEAVANSSDPKSPTEINREIGLPKQSIHRLCQTLLDEGFLIRDVSGKKLLAAPRALKMANGLVTSTHQNVARHQVLLSLSEATRETVNFAVPESDGMTYLDRVETDWIFRIELPIGSRVPFHCTASGKCFLASLQNRDLDNFLNALKFEQRTANTIMSEGELRKELTAVRRDGFARDNEELFDGMVALAVPVLGADGRFQAAVAFHGPTQRLQFDKLPEHLDVMRKGAAQLSQLSG
jgi:DNA-binding IclR family transcriptional regulator